MYYFSGGENLPTSTAGRTIISSWWIFCIISIAVYSGNLTATLAVNKQKLPFTTVDEMIKQKVYKWGTLGNSAYPSIFKVCTYYEQCACHFKKSLKIPKGQSDRQTTQWPKKKRTKGQTTIYNTVHRKLKL